MAASVSAQYNLLLQVTETLATSFGLASDPQVVHQISGASGTLNSSTSAPATKCYAATNTLTAGAQTLDLTSLTGPFSSTITFNGLKVQLVRITADANNTHPLVIDKGATNGYELFGDSNGQLTLPAGSSVLLHYPDKLGDVGSSAKTIDLSSSQSNAAYSIILVAG